MSLTFACPNNAKSFFTKCTSKTNLTARRHFVCELKKQGTCQVHQQVSLQYFCFLFLWQDIVKICLSLTWSCILCIYCFVCFNTSDHQYELNPFSLAADFVCFFVCVGPVRTDIFVCIVILLKKHLAIVVEEAELPLRFLLRHL